MFNLFKRQPQPKMYYKTPEIDYPALYLEMAKQAHLLIAGQTGSGKSVTLNGIVYTLLQYTPNKVQFIMIDPKSVELALFKDVPHVIEYAAHNEEILHALRTAVSTMHSRFAEMASRHERTFMGGSDIYVIIDELAQVTLNLKKTAVPLLQELLQLGRAARIHVIAATQNPIAQVVPTVLKVNFTGIVGLKTLNAQQSRNIIGVRGCEEFPTPRTAGKALGYYLDGCTMELYNMPMIADAAMQAVVDHWSDPARYIVYQAIA